MTPAPRTPQQRDRRFARVRRVSRGVLVGSGLSSAALVGLFAANAKPSIVSHVVDPTTTTTSPAPTTTASPAPTSTSTTAPPASGGTTPTTAPSAPTTTRPAPTTTTTTAPTPTTTQPTCYTSPSGIQECS
ncbi:MAG TPA: hypothetical protein VGG17_07555 [Acidimicrobiales bacterium]